MNVRELIEMLSEVEDQEREILVAHQPSWPLQERLAGVYDPADPGVAPYFQETLLAPCDGCLEEKTGLWWVRDEDDESYRYCGDCYDPEEEEAGPRPYYLVAGGHPHGLSPYAPRQAFAAL